MARCPAHEDKTPSLSIRDSGDGRLLLHDFGGCDVGQVLAAIGLNLSDLFDTPLAHCAAPSRTTVPARDVLELLSHEIDVVVIILADVVDGKAIDEQAWQRLAKAAARIGRARDHVNGG